jgi:hypothetical protein
VSLPGQSGTIPCLAIRTKENPMTSIHTYDPNDGAALPELPPLPIGILVTGAADLLNQAADLPQPIYITVYRDQEVTLQFAQDQASLRAITRWTIRFGGVVISEPHQSKDGRTTHVHSEFDFYGITVRAYAFIPAKTATI